MLTEGVWASTEAVPDADVVDRRRRRRGVRGERRRQRLRVPGLRRSSCGVPAREPRWPGRLGDGRRRGNHGELRDHLRRRSWRKSAALVLLSWLGRWLRCRLDAGGRGRQIKESWQPGARAQRSRGGDRGQAGVVRGKRICSA